VNPLPEQAVTRGQVNTVARTVLLLARPPRREPATAATPPDRHLRAPWQPEQASSRFPVRQHPRRPPTTKWPRGGKYRAGHDRRPSHHEGNGPSTSALVPLPQKGQRQMAIAGPDPFGPSRPDSQTCIGAEPRSPCRTDLVRSPFADLANDGRSAGFAAEEKNRPTDGSLAAPGSIHAIRREAEAMIRPRSAGVPGGTLSAP